MKQNKTSGISEIVLVDAGVSDKRLLVVEGEFAQVLRLQGREGNTLSTCIRNFWDTGNIRSLTKNNPLRTTDAHVSIIGHITKDELLLRMSETESSNGYCNRFLFVAVKREKMLPFGGQVPEAELKTFRFRLEEAINFGKNKSSLNFSIAASKIWVRVYEKLETSRFGYLGKITQRASPYVMRLSCIFALLDKSPLIEKEHLEAGLSVWQYAEDSARYIFGESLGNRTADKILAALKDSSETGMSRTEIRNLFDRHIKTETMETALGFLLENNLAEPKKVETSGRAKEVWFPCVLSEKSVQRSENVPDEEALDALNAYNATDGDYSEALEESLIPAGTEV